tara:strand:+ start:56 stop:190 length:135 start_codon:yes stop_codon:yes gene_type:complete
MSEKIVTTNALKGNPWQGTQIDKDRRNHNLKNKSRGSKRAKKSS